MAPSFLFNSTFKCYRISTKTAVSPQFRDIFNDAFKTDLKDLVVGTIFKDIQLKKQSETLFNELYENSQDHELSELNELIRVDHRFESLEVASSQFSMNFLSIRSNDSNIFKPQLFIFITDRLSSNKYDTILLVRSIPKLNNVVLRLLVNNKGVLLNQLKISSNMLKQCLDSSIGELVAFKSGLELTFGNFNTINHSLSNVTLNIEHEDLKRLSATSSNFSEELFKYLKTETAISFDKVDLIKVSCNIFYLNSDGRLKLFNDYNMGQSTGDVDLSWSIIKKLF